MFDLGEKERVVIISVTEGDDKPIKYPDMFHTSTLCIINKTDLLPYVNFNMDKAKEYARQVNPALQFIELSCTSGEGLSNWYPVSYTHLRAHETVLDLVCRLLLEKKKKQMTITNISQTITPNNTESTSIKLNISTTTTS